MAIAFRAITATGTSGAGSVSIAVPVGTTTSDVMVAAVCCRGNVVSVTAPVGWTLIQRSDEGSHMSILTYWKEWISGDTTFTWTFGNPSTNSANFIISYSGCYTAAPIDAFGTTITGAASTTVPGPSIVTNYANDMLLAISASEASGQVFTGPSSYTSRGQTDSHGVFNNSGCSIEVEDLAFVGPGATTAWTTTQGVSKDSFGSSIALRDANSTNTLRLLASTGVGR